MKPRFRVSSARYAPVVLGVAIVLVLVGCSPKYRRYATPSFNPSTAAAAAMESFDSDKDGKISGAELGKCPSLKAAMETMDKDGDGAITAQEISDRINRWVASKVARKHTTATVFRDRQPLANATIKFVPESFLGDSLTPATGKTDSSGRALVTVALTTENDLPGVAPGLYRVEITKEGANISAKYNTETILGVEVAEDVSWADPKSGELVFKLK